MQNAQKIESAVNQKFYELIRGFVANHFHNLLSTCNFSLSVQLEATIKNLLKAMLRRKGVSFLRIFQVKKECVFHRVFPVPFETSGCSSVAYVHVAIEDENVVIRFVLP